LRSRLLTVGLLLAAVACYVAGLAFPAAALLLLGAGLELVFWVRLLRPSQARKKPID